MPCLVSSTINSRTMVIVYETISNSKVGIRDLNNSEISWALPCVRLQYNNKGQGFMYGALYKVSEVEVYELSQTLT